MRTLVQLAKLALIGLIAVGALYAWDRFHEPHTTALHTVDTVEVSIQSPPERTPREPDTRVLYDTLRDTVTQRVPVPVDMSGRLSVVDTEPISISRSALTLRRYDTSAGRYVEDQYDVPLHSQRIGPVLRVDAWAESASVAAGVQYDRDPWALQVGYRVGTLGHSPYLALQVRPVLYRW